MEISHKSIVNWFQLVGQIDVNGQQATQLTEILTMKDGFMFTVSVIGRILLHRFSALTERCYVSLLGFAFVIKEAPQLKCLCLYDKKVF